MLGKRVVRWWRWWIVEISNAVGDGLRRRWGVGGSDVPFCWYVSACVCAYENV